MPTSSPPLRDNGIIDPLWDILSFALQLHPGDRRYRFSRHDLPSAIDDATRDDNLRDGDDDDDDAASSVLATFDVLSYNVNHAAVLDIDKRRNIVDAILSSMADIVLLQETNPRWETILTNDVDVSSRYGYKYFHHPGDHGTNERRRAGGMAILSRRPMDHEDVEVLDMSHSVDGSVFPALICDVIIPMDVTIRDPSKRNATRTARDRRRRIGGTAFALRIANVHLRPPLELDGTSRLDTGRITGHVRLAEAMELIARRPSRYVESFPPGETDDGGGGVGDCGGTEEAEADRGVRLRRLDVIAGDFNEGDHNCGMALSYLADIGYANALHRYVPRWKETHIWPFFNLGGGRYIRLFLRKRLDHVLWHRDAGGGGGKSSMRRIVYDNDDGDDDDAASVAEERYRNAVLRCVGCGVITGYEMGASDHQPVLSRFVIRQTTPG